MKAYTRRRLLASLKLGLAAVPFMVAMQLVRGDPLTPGAFLFGFGMGLVVGIAELFWLRNRLKGLGFFAHLVAKSLVIVGLIWLAFVVLNLLDVIIEGISWSEYLRAITEPRIVMALLQALSVIAFLLFFVQLDRLLGPGVLLGYVTGRYHHPRREERVFMFLDLRSSTEIAERIGHKRFFELLRELFQDVTEPVIESDGDIYQYVGDEVVITWPVQRAIEDDNCIACYFRIERVLGDKRAEYLDRFGVEPDFKAGVHVGRTTVGEIGVVKKDIVFSGDVLNTTSRIQQECNRYDVNLLASTELLRRLRLSTEYLAVPLGEIQLRGKAEALELSAVRMATA